MKQCLHVGWELHEVYNPVRADSGNNINRLDMDLSSGVLSDPSAGKSNVSKIHTCVLCMHTF